MNWTDQTETMSKVWAEAQEKMWRSWFDLSQAAAPVSTSFFSGLADQWQEMASQGFKQWTAEAQPTAKQVADRLFAGQKASMRFLEFSIKAWQEMAKKVEAGQDWQSLLAAYGEQLQEQLIQGPEAMFRLAEDSDQLWQIYSEQIQQLISPWLNTWQQTLQHFGQNGAGMSELTKLYWDSYDQTFGRLVESPGFGYSRELDEKIRYSFKVWERYRQADFAYQLIVAEAWVKLFERFQQELIVLAQKGEKIERLEQLANFWIDLGDQVFIEVFRSERYILAQGELLSATMAYRIQQREIIELVLKAMDIPTRTEVDQVHRNVYQQRKEIKSLKKSLAAAARQQEDQTKKDKRAAQTKLNKARQTIKTLQEEVSALKDALSELTAETTQIAAIRQEIDALKQAAKPARTARTKKPSAPKKAAASKAKTPVTHEEDT